ncbi:hypothetical protein CHS0354_031181 [Potamilus streckersoni]|uniref:Uncharacterized protein n=1 Tax=Potamilus streckersoni TaxID=2493646 RepID=A0AAE0TKK2_9BIVA|nr:hypothetical protein CHS0354_031181 [Potamilus streckersoni]
MAYLRIQSCDQPLMNLENTSVLELLVQSQVTRVLKKAWCFGLKLSPILELTTGAIVHWLFVYRPADFKYTHKILNRKTFLKSKS